MQPKALMTGLLFGESPRWHQDRLWVSDWGARQIVAVDLEGKSEVMVRLPPASFQPVCMDWLPDGRLLVVSAEESVLLGSKPDGTLDVYADLRSLSKTGWNEIVVDGRGNAYVNGGGLAPPSGDIAPGVIALVKADGSIAQVADDFAFPNGMTVTPDNSTLIIAESHRKRLTAFDIGADGRLSHRRVWADLSGGVPDGICSDVEGAVWYADVPNKRCVRVREGGAVLQTIELDRGCFACALGGSERTTLFMVVREWRGMASATDRDITADVVFAPAPARGAGWP